MSQSRAVYWPLQIGEWRWICAGSQDGLDALLDRWHVLGAHLHIFGVSTQVPAFAQLVAHLDQWGRQASFLTEPIEHAR